MNGQGASAKPRPGNNRQAAAANRLMKKCLSEGCSKTSGCKAYEAMRNEAATLPYTAMTNDKYNEAGGCFSTAC